MKRLVVVASLVVAAGWLAFVSPTLGQGSLADYQRAGQWREATQDKVFRDRIKANWLSGNQHFWYRVQTAPGEHRFVLVNAHDGSRRDAFDHHRVASALSSELAREIDPDQLPMRTIRFDDELAHVYFFADRVQWQWSVQDEVLSRQGTGKAAGTTVTVMSRLQSTQRTGEETSVQFVNRLQQPAMLYWIDRSGQPIQYGSIDAEQEREQHTFAGHVWVAKDSEGNQLGIFQATEDPGVAVIGEQLVEVEPPSDDARPREESPDGRWRALIKRDNVFVENLESGELVQLSSDGTKEDCYRDNFRWSPDSTRLVTVQVREGDRRVVHVVESSPADQLQPKLHTFQYDKPGDRLPVPRPRLFDVTAAERVEVDEQLCQNAWSISQLRWQPDSRRFTYLFNERGHQRLRIVAVDAKTGHSEAIVEETSDTFIDYTRKVYSHYLDETDEIVWMSERDGWNHLYLYDATTGEVKNRITQGRWLVREITHVDEHNRQIWFLAGGVHPEQDPYYLHLCRVNFDGSDFVVLTQGNGTHRVEFSPDREFLVDTYSRVDLPPVTELRRADTGELVVELERGEAKLLEEIGWRPPERFVAKARDGETDIYGIIHRPSNFDPQLKYPVIEKIYAGPHGAFVPKAFNAYHGAAALAELGFIVVQIDGMGTSNRSKAFHDICWKNLGDSGFPDRILWMQAAAEQYPEMDLGRVGIYGGSAGGQSALRALLAFGDFYDVGVADCGCHDNRMDKVWWNEQWMGWPIGPHYEEQSNVTQAHKLRGKLLLTVGELDRNVDPASTMQVVNALIEADKDFDLVVFPGAGHGAGSSEYGVRRRNDFFVRHLHGVEPRRVP